MLRRADGIILALGLLLSFLLHGTVIIPAVMSSMHADPPDRHMLARFDPDDFQEIIEQPPPPELRLGIEAQTPSTFTWVGYEEYREHLVALAELEQAAFTTDPEQNPSEAAAGSSSAITERSAMEPAPPEVQQEAPRTVAPAAAAVRASLRTLREWFGRIDLEALEDQLPDAARPSAAREAEDESPQPISADAAAPAAEAPPVPERTATGDADGEQSPANTQETPAARPGSAPGASGEPGDVADKESDPSTTIEVPLDQIKLGQPVARPGLELKPRRPHFTLLTRMTASPGNPLVEVRFGRDGIPELATVLRSSGNITVDHAVETSLYRWRASGKQLEDLAGDETLNIRILIILNPRATK